MSPWVSVVCTCYNHATFVRESLYSVINQTYSHIELIVIDNASTDNSAQIIEEFIQDFPHVIFLRNTENVGLCRAFNQGLKLATGKYIIDLAADDVLLPTRLQEQVEVFEQLPTHYGVVFSNCMYINEIGNVLGYHFNTSLNKSNIPTGDVFSAILHRYFVCTPTIMMRKKVLDELGGYDENLAYEDFDFFVRSSRHYHYHYIDKVLTQKRLLDNSLSSSFYKVGNDLLRSSYVVCQKAWLLCKTEDEKNALAHRIHYFIHKCFIAQNPLQAMAFKELLKTMNKLKPATLWLVWLCQLNLPVNKIYLLYARKRNKHNILRMQQGVAFDNL